MATNVTIQRMTAKDAHTCWELDQRCFVDGEAYDLDTFRFLLSDSKAVARKVRLADGDLIGFAVGMLEPGGVGHVISVGVAPEWRRRGVGKLLMEEMERGFAKRGATIVRLEVRTDNVIAQQLYLKLGYTIAQQIPQYYANGDEALVMVKSLPARRSFWRFGY